MKSSRGRAAVVVGVTAAVLLILTQTYSHRVPMGTVLYGVLYGSLNGLMAIGLVLIYRVTGAINFAYGSMGAVGAAAGVSLYQGHHWPWAAAIAAGLGIGAVLGLLAGAFVNWRFAKSPRLVLTVATIGASQLLIGLAAYVPKWLHGHGGQAGSVTLLLAFQNGLSHWRHAINPVVFTGNDVVIAITVPAVVVAATWYLLRTDSGRAVRAIADNPERARLLGVPASTLLVGVWALSGVIAALALILQAPANGVPIDPTTGPTLLLAPLAAAVVARMESMPTAFGAAIGLGVLEYLIRLNVSKQSVESVVLLGVVVVALLLQRTAKDRARGADDSTWSGAGILRPAPAALRNLPEYKVAKLAGGLALAGFALSLPAFLAPGRLDQVSVGIVFGLVALSLVVLSGWGGIVSLGQIAIVGVGAVAAGDLMMKLNVDLFFSLAAGGLAGAVIAVILGLPALRVKGLYLAVTTLAFAVAADQFFFNPTNFGNLMPSSVLRPVLWKRFNLQGEGDLYLVCLGILVLAIAAVYGIRRSRSGRVVLATRDNLRGAEAAAVPPTQVRLSAFVLAGFIAGVAGGLYVVILGHAGVGTFPSSDSLVVFSMTVIGGIASIPGALAGVGLVQWIGIEFPKVEVLLTGIGVLVVVAVFPSGLAGVFQRARDLVLVAVARRRGMDTSVWGVPLDEPPPAIPAVVEDEAGVLLRCSGVNASYGSLQVLFGVDLSVHEGEILALLGTNGAGKSSLLRVITGLLPAGRGRVILGGRPVTWESTERIAAAGLTMMPGGRGVFPSLTVSDNLRVASWLLRRDSKTAESARAEAVALFPILTKRADTVAGNLSGGEQQMLSLAMAFLRRPRLLCIDELSLGLAPTVVASLIDAVRHIRDQGTTVVLVEQSVNLALLVAERAVFLEKGQVRFSGPTDDLLDRPDLLRAVFLGPATEVTTNGSGPRRRRAEPEPVALAAGVPVLECSGLVKRYGGITAVNRVDLAIRPGEVVGLIGHNGAGKTTLFDVLSGFTRPDEGRIVLSGVDVTGLPAHQRAIGGLGRSFQEARLFPTLTVAETISVAMERHLDNRDPIAAAFRAPASTDSEARAREDVDRIIDTLGLEPYRDRPTADLSTGTRRIVELGCVLAHRPSVLLLDEPTSGVAQAETESLGPLLRKVAAETGSALVVIEHDMAMVSALSDRLVALELGAVIADGKPAEVLAHPDVIKSYLGTDADSLKRSGRRTRPKAPARPLSTSAARATVAVAERVTTQTVTAVVEPVSANGSEPPVAGPPRPVAPGLRGRLQQFRADLGPVGWAPLGILAGLAAVQNFDSSAFGVLAPEIRHSFHLDNASLNTVTGLTAAVPLLAAVFFGNLGDRGNRVRISRYSALLWGVTAILTGAAPVLAVLVVARLFGGVGLLASQTIYPSMLSDYYAQSSQAAVFTVYLLASTVIGLLSSPFVGAVGSAIGWRPAFIVLALPTFVFAALLRWMREPGHHSTATQARVEPLGGRLTVRESFRSIRAIRTLRRQWLGAFFLGGAVIPVATLISTFFKDVYHLGPTARGAIVGVSGVGGLIGLALAGSLAQRFITSRRGWKLPFVAGGAGAMVAVFAALTGALPALWLSIIAITFVGVGAGGFFPAYIITVTLVTPSTLRSQAYAWSLVFFAFGAIAISGFVGAIADAQGYRTAFVIMGLIIVLGSACIATSARFARDEIDESATDISSLGVGLGRG